MDDITRLTQARWHERLIAFIVDVVLLSVVTVGFMLLVYNVPYDSDPFEYAWQTAVAWVVTTALPLAYFTVMEAYTGTTVGRRLFRLYVVDGRGEKPELKGILVHNIGKSFLPVIDFLVGFALYRRTRQRAFSRLGGVFVAKVGYSGSVVPFNPD